MKHTHIFVSELLKNRAITRIIYILVSYWMENQRNISRRPKLRGLIAVTSSATLAHLGIYRSADMIAYDNSRENNLEIPHCYSIPIMFIIDSNVADIN